jgi:hypothetical protein
VKAYSYLDEKRTYHDGPFPYTTSEFELRGDSDFVLVPRRALKDRRRLKFGETVCVGPYKFLILEERFEFAGYAAIRFNGLGSRARAFVYQIVRAFEPFKDRFIITLAVWGAASYRYGAVPSIHDIYLVQWADRAIKKTTNNSRSRRK